MDLTLFPPTMKTISLSLLLLLTTLLAHGQTITGQWNGLLTVPGAQLRLVANIARADTGYTATLDSPDQGAKGIPITSVRFADSTLTFAIAPARITYTGRLTPGGTMAGTFTQGGRSFPLTLSRGVPVKTRKARPQEPVPPYPYKSEEVTFVNPAAGVTLAGTLTLPAQAGPYPVVVLLSGSGPQNRNEELMDHRPFLVLADFLTRNGIAVLRYDDRGTAQSTGDFGRATSVDFAADAEAAVNYLLTRADVDHRRVGLVGHSEGGLLAPMVAAQAKTVAFIVLLAGPGLPGDQILLLQSALIAKANGVGQAQIERATRTNKGLYGLIRQAANTDTLRSALRTYLTRDVAADSASQRLSDAKKTEFVNGQVQVLTSPWYLNFVRYDPAPALQKVTCPVLALNGEKDVQVSPDENLVAIARALKAGRNRDVTIKKLPGLNHLFQECTTGLPDEYEKIDQTFSPVALTEILTWLQARIK
jgi:uncharacterized protein